MDATNGLLYYRKLTIHLDIQDENKWDSQKQMVVFTQGGGYLPENANSATLTIKNFQSFHKKASH